MGRKEITIQKRSDRIMLDLYSDCPHLSGFLKRDLTKKEWQRVVNRLYGSLYLHEWKKSFVPEDIVLDGEQWELQIRLTGSRVRNYNGSNAFPPYWRELLTTFKPFFKEAEARLLDEKTE